MATIVLVDDTLDVHDFVKRALGKEHTVFTTTQWTDVSTLVFQHDVELILMDVDMPGFMKGDKVTGILKKSLAQKPVKIVLFSAQDEFELRKKAKEVNADGYIPKTSNELLLQRRVRKFLK